jgi:hypothetical protein
VVEKKAEIRNAGSGAFIHQATKLKTILSNGDDSEVAGIADELLIFLNRLHDFLQHNVKVQTPVSSMDDIIHGLESNPDLTLHDKSVRERLLNLFMKLSLY